MATLNEIIQYSKANPNTDYAKKAYEHIVNGDFDAQAQKEGIDLSKFGRPALQKEESLAEKVGDFTGGTKIAQGLGQALTAPENAKMMENAATQANTVQEALIKRIHEKEARGEDASHLRATLHDLGDNIATIGAKTEGILNPNHLTGEQVAGDALQLGTTIAGVGSFGQVGADLKALKGGAELADIAGNSGKLVKEAPSIVKGVTEGTGILKGALKGALKGGLGGAAAGGATGIAQGMKENKDLSGVLKEGAVDAALGGATGGVLGGITGGIAGKIKANQLAKQNNTFIDTMITPPTDKGKVALTAIKTGKVKEGTGFLGERDFTGALPNFDKIKESVSKVPGISEKQSNLENLNAIHDAIGSTANDLKSKLEANGSSFTPAEFNKYMKNIKSSLGENPTIVGDSEKSANKILTKFNTLVKENGYTPSGLLQARKDLDMWIGSQKGNVFNPSSENAISMALKAIRQGGNNFIAEKVPDVAVRDMLSHQTNLYNAIDILAPKALQEGTTLMQRVVGAVRAHPVGSLLGTAALGVAGGETVRRLTGF